MREVVDVLERMGEDRRYVFRRGKLAVVFATATDGVAWATV